VLTGVALAPDDLLAALTGCVMPMPTPSAGRQHQGGWVTIDLMGGAILYLRRNASQWQLRAARRGDWQIEYPAWGGAFPQTVRLHSTSGSVDLEATLSQLETNTALESAAFEIRVPAGAIRLTLDELREAGPLRGQ
jgi:hypothetical protein